MYGFTCGIVADGTQFVLCWGKDNYYQSTPPTNVGFIQISCGTYHSCGILATEPMYAMCWGRDAYGESTPPGAATEGGLSSVAFVQAGSGKDFSCGILADLHTVRCWGSDIYDQSTPPGSTYDASSATSTASTASFHFDESEQCEWFDTLQPTRAPTSPLCSYCCSGKLGKWQLNTFRLIDFVAS